MQLNVKCKNREPFLDELVVQNGWETDGRRKMIVIPNAMSKSCNFDLKNVEPGCVECTWRTTKDPRDNHASV